MWWTMEVGPLDGDLVMRTDPYEWKQDPESSLILPPYKEAAKAEL